MHLLRYFPVLLGLVLPSGVICLRSQTIDSFNPGAHGSVNCIAVQSDHKLLVAGDSPATAATLFRLNEDGTPDTSFQVFADSVWCVVAQEDEKTLAGGWMSPGAELSSYFGRFNSDGTVDIPFKHYFDFTDGDIFFCMTIQSDGKILVGGYISWIDGQVRKNIVRLNNDGTLDTNFNPIARSYVSSIALQPDGKILVGGAFTMLAGEARSYIGRLNSDGTLDTNFNPGARGYVDSLAVQPDGKILVGGDFTNLVGQARTNIGRLNPDGTLDITFNPGSDGSIIYPYVLQADGKILVLKSCFTAAGQSRTNIGRLNPD